MKLLPLLERIIMVVVVQLVVVSRKPSIYGPRCVVVSMEFGSRKQESWNSSFHLAKHEETRTGTRLGYDGCCGSLFGTKARQRQPAFSIRNCATSGALVVFVCEYAAPEPPFRLLLERWYQCVVAVSSVPRSAAAIVFWETST